MGLRPAGAPVGALGGASEEARASLVEAFGRSAVVHPGGAARAYRFLGLTPPTSPEMRVEMADDDTEGTAPSPPPPEPPEPSTRPSREWIEEGQGSWRKHMDLLSPDASKAPSEPPPLP